MDERQKTCCIMGLNLMPAERTRVLLGRLNDAIEMLIRRGVTHFLSCCTPGFDMVAASIVLAKKSLYPQVSLTFVLSSLDEEKLWTEAEQTLFRQLTQEGDFVVNVSELLGSDNEELRVKYLTDNASTLLCYYDLNQGDYGSLLQTFRRRKLRVINIAP